MRACDICGGVDDTTRHVTNCSPDTEGAVPSIELIRTAIENGADDSAVEALLDPTTLIRHMACCAANGCKTCAASSSE